MVLGVPTSITACRLGGDHLPGGLAAPDFLASALTGLAAFALLARSGLALRLRPDFHKRLMLLSNFPPLIAVFRSPGFFLHLNIGVTPRRNLLLLAFILIDKVRTRRLHPALVAGGACLIAADAGASALGRHDGVGRHRPRVEHLSNDPRTHQLERNGRQTVPQTRNDEIDEGAQLERQAVLLVVDQVHRTGVGS